MREQRDKRMKYPQERRETVLKKMLPPSNKSIAEIAKEENISEATLYNWRKAARAEGRLLPIFQRFALFAVAFLDRFTHVSVLSVVV